MWARVGFKTRGPEALKMQYIRFKIRKPLLNFELGRSDTGCLESHWIIACRAIESEFQSMGLEKQSSSQVSNISTFEGAANLKDTREILRKTGVRLSPSKAWATSKFLPSSHSAYGHGWNAPAAQMNEVPGSRIERVTSHGEGDGGIKGW